MSDAKDRPNPDFKKAEVKKELLRRHRINNHLAFMDYTWMPSTEPFQHGFHTKRICDRIDRALFDLKNGKSTYLQISVHQRSGKSQIVSVYLPPRILAMFPEYEIMQVSYNQNKAQDFSADGLRLVDTPRFKELFPKTRVGKEAVGNWNLIINDKGTLGRIYSSGLNAGLTGHGCHIGILDDFCGSRRDAESSVARNNMWSSFTNDFMTRLAPVHIVLVLATWWHVDDIHGRIKRKNDPTSEDYDPDFPKFEHLSFPARAEDWEEQHPEEEKYPNKYLFMERFEESWYKAQYAILGTYSSSAMMDNNPSNRYGNILNTQFLHYHYSLDDFPKNLKWYRVWDYAHSKPQTTGQDPDYTGGTLIAFELLDVFEKQKRYAIWIRDYVQFREKGPKRDQNIKKIAKDEKNKILVERSLDSIDGAESLKSKLFGIRLVSMVSCPGDKVVRCDPIESIFEAGNVHLLKAPWNVIWERGIRDFDGTGSTHDEMVDNITCAYHHHVDGTGYKKLPDPYL